MAGQSNVAERTLRELTVTFGFPMERAQQAVEAIGDKGDVQMAYNWLLDHGEEDKGGAVEFKHCPHLDLVASSSGESQVKLIDEADLRYGCPCCEESCSGGEQWVCLTCGDTRCSRYVKGHNLQHYGRTKQQEEAERTVEQMASNNLTTLGHCAAISLGDLSIWCYACESYVRHPRLQPLFKQMQALKFGPPSEEAAQQTSEADEQSNEQSATQPRDGEPMQEKEVNMHGIMGQGMGWAPPRLVATSNVQARPGYQTMSAAEYMDEDEVLEAKVQLLADLCRQSQRCVAYTGAGISTSSGIRDYATKAARSQAIRGDGGDRNPLDVDPTPAHRGLAKLYHSGILKHWIQQNHDGLPQKAGMPQEAINEIHGAWFDPSNPVVPMDGTLRKDLIEDMLRWEANADLVLTLGTSLAGMTSACMRHRRGAEGELGAVLVSLQRTQVDGVSSLRIFATIDRVVTRLTELLLSDATTQQQQQQQQDSTVLERRSDGAAWEAEMLIVHESLPYDPVTGDHSSEVTMRLDLRPGSKVYLKKQPSWDRDRVGGEGTVLGCDCFGNIRLDVGGTERRLGRWWVDEAKAGTGSSIPISNNPLSLGLTPLHESDDGEELF